MTSAHTDLELKFLVPATGRAALAAELAGRGSPRRVWLTTVHLDTPDQRLAGAGLAWRMCRADGRWVQGLKTARGGAAQRVEHETVHPDAGLHASPDAAAHADSAAGRRLAALLAQARQEGVEAGIRFQSRVLRLERRVRTRGAVVSVALDEGRLTAGDAVQKIRVVRFGLVSGSPVAMLALVERWRRRHRLVHDPRGDAEQGQQLAAGSPQAPLRKARTPRYDAHAGALDAFGAAFDECLAQVCLNAVGLANGDPGLRVEQVHQMRVGIRRLRSALRAFRGWVDAPPAELVDGLRALFAELGRARESDVFGSGVAAELARVGAPLLTLPAQAAAPAVAALIRADATQRLLLGWIAWRAGLQPQVEARERLKRLARQRLRRWHRDLADACRSFDELDEAALHALRKHAKRQRYSLEFFAPLLPQGHAARHLQALGGAQESLGEINDLVVARNRYQALVASDPAAWFAVGWLTARLAEARERARGELGRLAAIENLPR